MCAHALLRLLRCCGCCNTFALAPRLHFGLRCWRAAVAPCWLHCGCSSHAPHGCAVTLRVGCLAVRLLLLLLVGLFGLVTFGYGWLTRCHALRLRLVTFTFVRLFACVDCLWLCLLHTHTFGLFGYFALYLHTVAYFGYIWVGWFYLVTVRCYAVAVYFAVYARCTFCDAHVGLRTVTRLPLVTAGLRTFETRLHGYVYTLFYGYSSGWIRVVTTLDVRCHGGYGYVHGWLVTFAVALAARLHMPRFTVYRFTLRLHTRGCVVTLPVGCCLCGWLCIAPPTSTRTARLSRW